MNKLLGDEGLMLRKLMTLGKHHLKDHLLVTKPCQLLTIVHFFE